MSSAAVACGGGVGEDTRWSRGSHTASIHLPIKGFQIKPSFRSRLGLKCLILGPSLESVPLMVDLGLISVQIPLHCLLYDLLHLILFLKGEG